MPCINRSSGPSSPNSLASAAMDESDSEAEPAPKSGGNEDDEEYPVDGMFMSEAEKAEIMAMREVEREQILAERGTEIDRRRQRRLLRQMIETEERKNGKKRGADTAELDESQRKPSRQRTGKAETAMDSLRRARAEKAKRKEDKTRGRDYSPGPRYSDDEQSVEDFGRDRARSRTPEKEPEKEEPAPELKDYERLRLGRNEFAQVCFTPGFEAAITGCYIRIALGPHPDTGIEQYRMAVVKGGQTVTCQRGSAC